MKQVGWYPIAARGDTFENKARRRGMEIILSTCHASKPFLSIFKAGIFLPTVHSRAANTVLKSSLPPHSLYSFHYLEIQIKQQSQNRFISLLLVTDSLKHFNSPQHARMGNPSQTPGDSSLAPTCWGTDPWPTWSAWWAHKLLNHPMCAPEQGVKSPKISFMPSNKPCSQPLMVGGTQPRLEVGTQPLRRGQTAH